MYVPKKGVYIVDSPKIVDGEVSLDKNDLARRVENEDSEVRFVPKRQLKVSTVPTYLRFGRNPFVRALAGDEGAKKLVEISKKCARTFYSWLWSIDNIKKPLIRFASFGSESHEPWCSQGFGVHGNLVGDICHFTFGISNKQINVESEF